MQSQDNYRSCQTKEDVWKLFGWQSKTAENDMESMEVDPLEHQEEAMEVDPIPADLAGYCNADSRACLKKGARRAQKVWPHPRLYRHGPSSLAVVRYAAGGKPRP